MTIVLAFDAFKGSLSAPDICRIAAAALDRPGVSLRIVPMADGGEGTLEALISARHGTMITVPDVAGPLPGQRLAACYAWLPGERTAMVEMARASGLTLVPESRRNPLITTTRGTGELLADALRRGAERLFLTLGGSATNDGGVGAAAALGWRFLDARGRNVPDGGGNLRRIARILPPESGRLDLPVEVLCDVDNPLCGPRGAAAVYGPQKGATPAMVRELDRGLAHLAELVRQTLGRDIRAMPGAGAAGGFGAGAVAFFGGRLVPGSEAVADAVHLGEALAGADWVVTGEGSLDEQSLRGKVVSQVLRQARERGVAVAVLAGRVSLSPAACRDAGMAVVEACSPPGMPPAEAMGRAEELARCACCRLADHLLPGGSSV